VRFAWARAASARNSSRWLQHPATFHDAAIADETTRAKIPRLPASPDVLLGGDPVFFGHYWLKGSPELMSPIAACVDWSIAAGGVLAAYTFRGEAVLNPDGFVTVG
jgi:hypothetical protein